MKRGLWWAFWFWLASHVVAGAVIAITDWSFFRRAVTYTFVAPITEVDWYEPMERIAGSRGGALPVGEWRGSRASLEAASAWAEDRRSSALLVAHRGELVLERYFGGAGRDSLTNSMSMSKTLIAMLVGVAIRDHSIASVDTSIGDLVPSWRGDRAPITVRDLLQMTAGLRRSAFVGNPWSDLSQMHMGTDARAVALSVPRVEPPRECFSYNNVNTQVLAAALENVTGRRLADYLSESLWQPLGASDAQWWLDREGGMPKAYCCVFARPLDWVRVGQLLQHRGWVGDREVVPEAWIHAMSTPSPLEPTYGLHVRLGGSGTLRTWEPMSEPFATPDVIFLDGKDFQRVYVVPSRELIVVRVGEAPWPWEWDESFLVNTLVRGLDAGSGGAAMHGSDRGDANDPALAGPGARRPPRAP